MSQHWIKVRESLHSDSRVITMAGMLATTSASYVLSASARDLLGVTPTVTRDVMIDVTVSSLIRVWIAGNQHTVDGVFHHATLDHLDTLSHVPGFGAAMAAVGYAIADPEARTVTLPNFTDHNAPTKAAKGNSASERQKRWRDKKRRLGDVTRDVTETPTETADKIRLDKSISERENNASAPTPEHELALQADAIASVYPRQDDPLLVRQTIIDELQRGTDPVEMREAVQKCAAFIRKAPGGSSNQYVPKARTFFTEAQWRSPEAFESRWDRPLPQEGKHPRGPREISTIHTAKNLKEL